MKRTIIAAIAFLSLVLPLKAEDQALQQYQNLLTPLVKGGTDTLGTPLVYPDGAVNITSAIVTLQPGAETGWHEHEVPLFGYILEGEMTVDYGTKGTKTYKAGDSFLEAINWPHNGVNSGAVPVRLIAVYMGAEGAANTVTTPAP